MLSENLWQRGLYFFGIAIAFGLGIVWERIRQKNAVCDTNLCQIQESEARLQLALKAAHMGIWNWNMLTGETNWTQETEHLFGMTPGTFDGRHETFLNCVHPDDRELLEQVVQKAIQEHKLYQHEYRIIWANGSIHWIESNGQVVYDNNNQPVRMTGTVIDISDRKFIQATLQRQTLQELAFNRVIQTIRNSLDIKIIFTTAVKEFTELLQMDGAAIIQYLPEQQYWKSLAEYLQSPESLSTFELEISDRDNPVAERLKQREILIIEDTRTFTDRVNPKVAQEVSQVSCGWFILPLEVNGIVWGSISAHKSPPPLLLTEDEIRLARWFADQLAIAIQQANLYQQVQQLNRELELRVQERTAALQESEEKFRQIAENINHVFYIEDKNEQIIYASPSYADIWGQTVDTLYQNSNSWLDAVHPEDLDRIIAERVILRKYHRGEIEYRIIRPNGEIRWISDRYFPIHNPQGEIYRIAGLAEDITHRKQAQLRLQRQAEADQLLATIAQMMNQSIKLDEVLATCLEQIRQFLQCDRVLVCRFASNYNILVELEAVSLPELSLFGQAIADPCFDQDWVERYHQGYITVCHDAQSPDIPPCYAKLLAQMQVRANIGVSILQAEQMWGLLMVHNCHTPQQWQPDEINLLKQLGLQIGIASQKASLYRQLENQLAQKEILLKEIHHRVKNNLQVISSMLWLQTEATNHPAVSQALEDTRHRLRAMSLIHETLYQQDNIGQSNFNNYIRRLARSILAFCSIHPEQIKLRFHLQPVVFNLETAMPCGLLLNELITNAIKHGFSDGRKGEICITLKQIFPAAAQHTVATTLTFQEAPRPQKTPSQARSQYILTIQDNGAGIPESLNLKQLKSLGLKIAYDLALQLEGKLELERTSGTLFRLTFSALEYGKRF
ncbi:PAS domain-containing protein [Nostoc sp. LEGE 06077]|uniref:PAS domain-containing protein n=1 Tax=Nostoc sp. LEGE 06077 TaxID=915325 RepID=UPI001882103A|nr:PAS domain-containing protein [Nostoc sp. LEGE 06077]MBE9207656.1 PAS domain-containing protein [Nostoc sp. LEGE 06077]